MGFELSQVPSKLETVDEFTERMKSATEEAKSAIRKAQEDMMLKGCKRELHTGTNKTMLCQLPIAC